jgi:hypothetical protein
MRMDLHTLVIAVLLAGAAGVSAQTSPYDRFILGASFTALSETSTEDLDAIEQLDSLSFNYWYTSVGSWTNQADAADYEAAAIARRGVPRFPE